MLEFWCKHKCTRKRWCVNEALMERGSAYDIKNTSPFPGGPKNTGFFAIQLNFFPG